MNFPATMTESECVAKLFKRCFLNKFFPIFKILERIYYLCKNFRYGESTFNLLE